MKSAQDYVIEVGSINEREWVEVDSGFAGAHGGKATPFRAAQQN